MTETCSQVALSANTWSSPGGTRLPTRLPERGRSDEAIPAEGGSHQAGGGGGGRRGRRPRTYPLPRILAQAVSHKVEVRRRLVHDRRRGRPPVDYRAAGSGGSIAILGRKEETIVSGGEKVFPAEVEAAIREHPVVKDAVVIGLDDPRWGQTVVAVVETRRSRAGEAHRDRS